MSVQFSLYLWRFNWNYSYLASAARLFLFLGKSLHENFQLFPTIRICISIETRGREWMKTKLKWKMLEILPLAAAYLSEWIVQLYISCSHSSWWWMWVNKSDPGILRFTLSYNSSDSTSSGKLLWCRKNLFIRIFHFSHLFSGSFRVEWERKKKMLDVVESENVLCLLVDSEKAKKQAAEATRDKNWELFWINNVIFIAASSEMNNNIVWRLSVQIVSLCV